MASRFPGAERREVIDGVEVVRTGGLLWLWLTTFLFYMRKARGRYDVVVTEGFGGSRIPRLTPLYVREPIITEWHQIHADLFAIQYPKPLVPFLNLLERATAWIHRNTIVMARTNEWRDAFPQIGFKPENIRVVPACIDEGWLTGQAELTREPQFVWLGKFRRYKCPDHAIRAMQEVVRNVPKARLTLAGYHDDRTYEASLQDLVHHLGLRGSVSFRFGITEVEKRLLLDSARAIVLPSSVEGFGIVVLEANARQVPVIASTGVPAGAVADGRNGLKYKFGDIPALARAIIRIASDPDFHMQLAASSLEFARRFEFRKVCGQYEEIILATAKFPRTNKGLPAPGDRISR